MFVVVVVVRFGNEYSTQQQMIWPRVVDKHAHCCA